MRIDRGRGRLGRGGRIPQDAPHLRGLRVAQDGHGNVAVAVQRDAVPRPGQRDAREAGFPSDSRWQREGEAGTPVPVGRL